MDALADAQAEHTTALRAWLSSRGTDEPAALARLDQARARVRDAFDARARQTTTTRTRWGRRESW